MECVGDAVKLIKEKLKLSLMEVFCRYHFPYPFVDMI